MIIAGLLFSVASATAQTYNTLGIGIASPAGTLHVHSSQPYIPPLPPTPVDGEGDGENTDDFSFDYSTIFRITNYNTNPTLTDGFTIEQMNSEVTLCQYEDADMKLINHNAKVILSSGGKVGIGAVSTGSHAFNVAGSSRFAGGVTVTGGMSLGGGLNINNATIHLTSTGKGYFADEVWIGSGFHCTAAGALKVKSLRVTLTDWSDYVFDPAYRLMPLDEVERHVRENRHLPGIPSAAEVEEQGIDVGEMNKLLLQKVEEMTLYIIGLQKQIDELKSNK